ncbi:AAA family ATPase, partial [Streptomyces californicus]
EKTIANYRSLAENDVVNAAREGGVARKQDLGRSPTMWAEGNPNASERAATFIFLASIVGTYRPGRGRGASAPEVKAATSIPDPLYTVTDADLVVSELVSPDGGMNAVELIPGQGNNKPARYFLSTRLTHRMLVANIKRTITETERDETIAAFAERLASSGPFRELKFVPEDRSRSALEVLTTAGIDTAHVNRLVVLDPAQFSLRNGMEQETMAALAGAMGLNRGAAHAPAQWASSAVYAVVNTQRRAVARGMAIEFLARQKALAAPEVQRDDELRTVGAKEVSAAKEQLEKTIRRAYQHVVFLWQPDPDGERAMSEVTFDSDNLTALDGTMVWKALAERQKTLDANQFTANALVHNLRDQDYGRSLSEVRSAFYNAPRLPLLYGGDTDLRHAIFDAVRDGLIRIVDGSDTSVVVPGPGQVNLSSTGLRLAKPVVDDVPPVETVDGIEESDITNSAASTSNSVVVPESGNSATKSNGVETEVTAQEKQLAFSFTSNLLNQEDAADRFAALFRSL